MRQSVQPQSPRPPLLSYSDHRPAVPPRCTARLSPLATSTAMEPSTSSQPAERRTTSTSGSGVGDGTFHNRQAMSAGDGARGVAIADTNREWPPGYRDRSERRRPDRRPTRRWPGRIPASAPVDGTRRRPANRVRRRRQWRLHSRRHLTEHHLQRRRRHARQRSGAVRSSDDAPHGCEPANRHARGRRRRRRPRHPDGQLHRSGRDHSPQRRHRRFHAPNPHHRNRWPRERRGRGCKPRWPARCHLGQRSIERRIRVPGSTDGLRRAIAIDVDRKHRPRSRDRRRRRRSTGHHRRRRRRGSCYS